MALSAFGQPAHVPGRNSVARLNAPIARTRCGERVAAVEVQPRVARAEIGGSGERFDAAGVFAARARARGG